MTSPTRSDQAHQLAWLAAGLRRAARGLGVDLPTTYAQAVAVQGMSFDDHLGVTRLGSGVVLHTQPEANNRLPILLGYADATGQWYRDGSRHQSPSDAPEPASQIMRGIET